MPSFLVTAGGTREPIDRVRDWGNVFTGNTGRNIAVALSQFGTVTLLTSNAAHLAEFSQGTSAVRAVPFRSYDDLHRSLESIMPAEPFDAVFMTAAVSDYSPAGAYQVVQRSVEADGAETWTVKPAQAGKVKSTFDELAILGRRTEKLVDLFRTRWQFAGLLVKFKLEVGIPPERLIEIGQASRRSSGADYLVANTLDMVDGPKAGAYLLSDGGAEWMARADLASRLARLVSR
jgi:phosphopantothenoylcysteine synthetase/decarboxylase